MSSLTRFDGPLGFLHIDLREVVYVGSAYQDNVCHGSYPHQIRIIGLRGGMVAETGDTEQNRKILLEDAPVGLGLLTL